MFKIFSQKRHFTEVFHLSQRARLFFCGEGSLGHVFELMIAARRCEFFIYKNPSVDQATRLWVLGYDLEDERSKLCISETTGELSLMVKCPVTGDSDVLRMGFGLGQLMRSAKRF